MWYFLGVEILHNTHGTFMCQKKYAQDVLSQFHMKVCNVVQNSIVSGIKLSRNGTRPKWMLLYSNK